MICIKKIWVISACWAPITSFFTCVWWCSFSPMMVFALINPVSFPFIFGRWQRRCCRKAPSPWRWRRYKNTWYRDIGTWDPVARQQFVTVVEMSCAEGEDGNSREDFFLKVRYQRWFGGKNNSNKKNRSQEALTFYSTTNITLEIRDVVTNLKLENSAVPRSIIFFSWGLMKIIEICRGRIWEQVATCCSTLMRISSDWVLCQTNISEHNILYSFTP